MPLYTAQLNDIIQVKVANQLFNQVAINVLHARCQGSTLGSVSLPEIAATLAGTISAIYKPAMTAQASHYGIQVGVLKVIPPPLPSVNTASGGPGTGGSNPMPGQTSGLVSMRTAQAGRKGRGRIYVPYPATDALIATSVQVTNAYKTLLTGIGAFFTGPFTVTGLFGTATFVWGVYGRLSVDVPPLIDFEFSIPRLNLATQRRRGELNQPDAFPFA